MSDHFYFVLQISLAVLMSIFVMLIAIFVFELSAAFNAIIAGLFIFSIILMIKEGPEDYE